MSRLRRLAGRVATGSLVVVIVSDGAALLAVAIAGAFVGYGDALSSIWAWRRDHAIESLVISVVVLVALRRVRRRVRRTA